eukprot:9166951-Pyramimonas_sp.AAC.1
MATKTPRRWPTVDASQQGTFYKKPHPSDPKTSIHFWCGNVTLSTEKPSRPKNPGHPGGEQ